MEQFGAAVHNSRRALEKSELLDCLQRKHTGTGVAAQQRRQARDAGGGRRGRAASGCKAARLRAEADRLKAEAERAAAAQEEAPHGHEFPATAALAQYTVVYMVH